MKKIKVTQDLIDNLSELSKLNFDQKQSQQIKFDLEKMLEFVNTISQINTDNVEPLVYVNEETKLLRKDEVKDSLSQTDALKNAPEKDSDYFKVPVVLKK
ncbi:MAG: Asp-tRNA(Asn)/Glu-tRNA(Gln) amidotransferase subunit GatC [Bacteroidota bacterium]|nr:Asp-tRNA(Asn)/Glu-tRNA(Gln) amidotransferase subunit GatC [Bacteroidota bacterium]|tara:strand:- start:267 stop:566 length:300 start_codon:yes stop_codon:yes gene_type:complete